MILTSSADIAKRFPKSIIVVREGALLIAKTFSEFASDVLGARSDLAQIGVERGNVIGICADNCYDWLVWEKAAMELELVTQVFLECSKDVVETMARAQGLKAVITSRGNASLGGTTKRLALKEVKPECAVYTRIENRDVLSRVYSSGTSGNVKGLEVTRSGTEHLVSRFLQDYEVRGSDRHVIFLPLSNYQQRVAVYGCLRAGVSFMLTSYAHVFEDVKAFNPTFLIAPPVIYETVVQAATRPETKELRRGVLRDLLGEKIRFLMTGMAPTRKGVLECLNEHDFPIFEAYGLTEVGMIAWNCPGKNRVGTVGVPIDQGSVSFGFDSEIMCRPLAPLTTRYFEESAENSQAVYLPDGRIATGDIGHMDGGFLILDGRKKDLILTSGGAKFHPEVIERIFEGFDEVQRCTVSNNSGRSELTAIVSMRSANEVMARSKVSEQIQRVNDGLPAYMRVSAVVFTDVSFSAENGLLTRNLKPDRKSIEKRFLS